MLVNVGHDNSVNSRKVVAVGRPGSAPVKRLVCGARDNSRLIDLCNGKACRSVVFVETGQIVLCSVRPRLLRERLNQVAGHISDNHTPSDVDDLRGGDMVS